MPWNWLFLMALGKINHYTWYLILVCHLFTCFVSANAFDIALFPLCLLYFRKCIRRCFTPSLLALFLRMPPISLLMVSWLHMLFHFIIVLKEQSSLYAVKLAVFGSFVPSLLALFPQASILFLLFLPWVCKNKAAAASCDARPLHGGEKGKKMISLSKGGGSPFDYDNSTRTLNQS